MRLSTFTTHPVSVGYRMDADAGLLAAGTVTFAPGETVKLLSPPVTNAQGHSAIRVTLRDPIGSEITGFPEAWFADFSTNAADLVVPAGTTWRYLDNGSNQGTGWTAIAFSDAGWAQGPAELGYGDKPGRPEATDEEVYAAARAVSADRVAAKLEQGYDTDVGECGDKLSTGEKQLMSFARAVIARPKIFVLDEATSSVDTETEMLIQKATHTLMQGTTSFVIAHRLSTIRQADVILVIDHGKIVEQGTHERLLKAGGAYAALYHTQLSRQE